MEISRDLQNNVKVMMAVDPVALGTTGNNAGRKIDRRGYGGVEFLVSYGSISTTGTNNPVVVKEGDTTGAMTSVADSDLIGTETLAGLLAQTPRTSGVSRNVCKRIGYKGSKRYVSIDIGHTGTTSVGVVGAAALLFNPETAPVSNP